MYLLIDDCRTYGYVIAKTPEALEVESFRKMPKEDYFRYIKRIGRSEDARRVKMADLEDNMDLSRLIRVGINPTEEDIKRQLKYEKAQEYLFRFE